MKKILFIFLLLLSTSVAYAVPDPTNVSGTVSDDSSVTITGTGFGTKSTAAPIKFDDFDDGSNGSSISTGGYWSTDGTAPKYNNTNLREGSGLNMKADLAGVQDIIYKGGLSIGTYFFTSFWCRFNQGTGDNSYQIKLWRVSDGSGASVQYPSFANYNWIRDIGDWFYYEYRDSNVQGNTTHSVNRYPEDTWFNIELEAYWGTTNGSNGDVKVWQDGSLETGTRMPINNKNFYIDANRFERIVFGEYIGNGGISTTIYFDDIYIDNSWARVYIANKPTWSQLGTDSDARREIQPPTAWSNTSVTITVNQGDFNNTENAWVYVVDSSGNVNETGLQVTFGGAATDTQEPTITAITPNDGAVGVALSPQIDLTISDNVSIDNSTFVAKQIINGGSPTTITSNFTKLSSSTTQTVFRNTSQSYTAEDSVFINYLIDDNSANSMDLTKSFTVIATVDAGDRFSTGDPGTRANYTEETASRWDTLTESGNVVCQIITTDYTGDANDVPGEVNYFSTRTYENFEMSLRARQDDNQTTNVFADFQLYWALQDTSNFYGIEVSAFDGQSHVYEISSAAKTNTIDWIDSEQTPNTDLISDNNFHDYIIRSENGSLTLFVDGDLRLSTDITGTAGYVGFGSYNDAATFDDVVITDLGAYVAPDPGTPIAAGTSRIRGGGTTSFGGSGTCSID